MVRATGCRSRGWPGVKTITAMWEGCRQPSAEAGQQLMDAGRETSEHRKKWEHCSWMGNLAKSGGGAKAYLLGLMRWWEKVCNHDHELCPCLCKQRTHKHREEPHRTGISHWQHSQKHVRNQAIIRSVVLRLLIPIKKQLSAAFTFVKKEIRERNSLFCFSQSSVYPRSGLFKCSQRFWSWRVLEGRALWADVTQNKKFVKGLI